jgi:Oxidoreductase family, NAD-binding Rossmann fold
LGQDAFITGRAEACPVRVAAIGCGYWGKNLVRNFAELGSLAAICDPDRNTARQLAERYHTRVAELDEVLGDDDIAGVAIAAPAALHAELASRALEAGKHVFVEKPLALTAAEAERLCALAERRDRRLMVGHLMQYHPAFIKLREMVGDGALGRLEYISSTRLNLGKVRREEDIWRALHHEKLPVDNGGIASRDFIFVDDIVRGLLACALHGKSGEVYNLASGIETSILDLAHSVNELTDNRAPLALAPARSWDRSGRRFGATEKARAQLKFAATTPLRDGLVRTIEWTQANRDMIASRMLQHERFMPELRAAYG